MGTETEQRSNEVEVLVGSSIKQDPSVAISALFYCVVFLSAFLLFELELVIAKYILPWFGGTPSVFTTCMLVFQILLLLGYGYAFLLESYASPRQQMILHCSITLAALGLLLWQNSAWHVPLLANARWRPLDSYFPIWHIFVVLAVSVSVPFFLLATTGPLLQSWWARMQRGLPYKLYALSNAGSLLGLLTYPVVFEPHSTLRIQAILWSVCFALFGCGVVALAYSASRSPRLASKASSVGTEGPPQWGHVTLWFVLSGCGSLLFVATTNQICQEVAVVPFLWVLPLSLYLLSFILCFATERGISRVWLAALLAAATIQVSVVLYESGVSLVTQIAIYSFASFAGCVVCHSELMRSRPATRYLTSFYLSVATGAALGTVIVTLIFPVIFKGYWEFHLGLWMCWALFCVLSLQDRASWIYLPKPMLLIFCALLVCAGPVGVVLKESRLGLIIGVAGVAALVTLLMSPSRTESSAKQVKAARFSVGFTLILLAAILLFSAVGYLNGAVSISRNFYGVLSVVKSTNGTSSALFLRHGKVIHGFQYLDASHRDLPTSYFGPNSGVGSLLRDRIAKEPSKHLRIGVIGLGVGTIAAYTRSGDYIRFYEINPDVIRLAYSGPGKRFSFLQDCHGKVDVVLGDARVSLERELAQSQAGNFDVLAIDAFSGDNIPVHLLTKEAVDLYLKHLNPSAGILAFHISNRSLDLSPVVAQLAQNAGRPAWLVDSMDPENGRSVWVLVGKFDGPLSSDMTLLHPKPGFRLWTDDYSSLFAVLR